MGFGLSVITRKALGSYRMFVPQILKKSRQNVLLIVRSLCMCTKVRPSMWWLAIQAVIWDVIYRATRLLYMELAFIIDHGMAVFIIHGPLPGGLGLVIIHGLAGAWALDLM